MRIRTVFNLIIIAFVCHQFAVSCNQTDAAQPGAGSDWGIIPNGSAEEVVSSEVMDWTYLQDRRGGAAIHFYSPVAHDGAKSLYISAEEPAAGYWQNKVNVKPWSKYRFTGWIKTEELKNGRGEGAGFSLTGVSDEFTGFSGTNDWQQVTVDFETGSDDCFILNCYFNRGWNARASGKVWFDDMKLELISSEEIETAITVHVDQEKEEMSEYIYGQFIEHLGKCIYGGIWAELIEDRKFWYAPDDRMSPWKVGGNKELLSMDTRASYVGDHTPVITVKKDEEVVLYQDGIGLRENVGYTGRIVVKASGDVRTLQVKLSDPSDGRVLSENIVSLEGNAYAKYPLELSSDTHLLNARLEIIPDGAGKVWIGTISLMPEDNVQGYRADVLELLKGLNSPVYRWPGGNFVSGYDWKDGIGEMDKRPPRKNPAWSGVEHNDVGIHEFMVLCELLDTEPYIAVNAGLGGAEEACKEVEYCNGAADTPMGKWRAQNGHPEPWKVKWWSVGNEMYGDWQLGHMSTEAFVDKHNEFAEGMQSVDPDIVLIAVGNPGRWNEMILSNCSDNMDLISEHFYKQDWHGGGLMTHVKQIPDAISDRAALHRKYRKEIPELEGKDIRICMDEWNYWYGPHIYGELGTRYFLRDALGIAAGLNEFSKNSDIIFMANYAQTVNVIGCIKTTDTDAVYASTGLALKMFRDHYGSIPVEIEGELRPFNVAATLTEDRSTLVVSVVNPTWIEQEFSLAIPGTVIDQEVEKYTLTGPDDMAYNEPGQEDAVTIKGPETVRFGKKYTVEPFSATLFRFNVETH